MYHQDYIGEKFGVSLEIFKDDAMIIYNVRSKAFC